jgi:hypothetical protein
MSDALCTIERDKITVHTDFQPENLKEDIDGEYY